MIVPQSRLLDVLHQLLPRHSSSIPSLDFFLFFLHLHPNINLIARSSTTPILIFGRFCPSVFLPGTYHIYRVQSTRHHIPYHTSSVSLVPSCSGLSLVEPFSVLIAIAKLTGMYFFISPPLSSDILPNSLNFGPYLTLKMSYSDTLSPFLSAVQKCPQPS